MFAFISEEQWLALPISRLNQYDLLLLEEELVVHGPSNVEDLVKGIAFISNEDMCSLELFRSKSTMGLISIDRLYEILLLLLGVSMDGVYLYAIDAMRLVELLG